MAEYKLLGDSKQGVKHIPTGRFIPNAPGNRHWREYQEWLKAGNEPEPQFTEEEQAEKTKQAEKAALRQALANADEKVLKLLLDLINVGVDKDLWSEQDFLTSSKSLEDVKKLRETLDALDSMEKGYDRQNG